MRFPELDGVPLALLEAAAAPLAVLWTLVVVVLGGVLATGIGVAGAESGASGALAEVLVGLVAILTVLALAATAGAAVVGYRRRFRRTGTGTQLVVGTFVPALGVVAPLAYAVVQLGTTSPPWWLLGVAVVAANAAALRTVAMYSTSRGHRRRGTVVAGVAGLPAAVGLTVLVTERFLDGAVAAAGARVVDGIAAAGIPRSGLLLVALPLVVAGAFGFHRARTAPTGASRPVDTSLPRSSTLPEPSRVPDASLRGVGVYVRERSPASLPVGGLLRVRSSNDSSGSPSSDGSDVVSPPVSARSSGGRGGGGDGRSAGSDGGSGRGSGSRGRSAGGGSGSTGGGSSGGSGARSSADGGSDDRRSSGSGGRRSSGGRSSGGDGDDSRSLRRVGRSRRSASDGGGTTGPGPGGGSSSSGTGSSGSDAGGSSSSPSTGGDGSTDDDGGTGSDTRIFSGSFGSFGDGGDTVERCPACEQTIPSDGVYRFCPFCGEEL